MVDEQLNPYIDGNHNKWDRRFLSLAHHISSWSKDPSTKVGSVIVDDDYRIISLGYNGFPKGIKDDDRYDNRALKYKLILHAERNAILFANRDLKGCTIYTYPFLPCSQCAAMIIQVGIKRVVSVTTSDEARLRWEEDFSISFDMLREAGIIVHVCNITF